jgi:hypothetical protein
MPAFYKQVCLHVATVLILEQKNVLGLRFLFKAHCAGNAVATAVFGLLLEFGEFIERDYTLAEKYSM